MNDLTNSKPRGTMRTFSGMYVNPLRPIVNIQDVAHGIAHTFRYNGQAPNPYTVAQHSVNVMHRLGNAYVPQNERPSLEMLHLLMQALLHDAHEAYIGDWILPLKEALPELRAIEDACQAHVMEQFGYPTPLDARIKEFDTEALYAEQESLWRPDACHPDRGAKPEYDDPKWIWTPEYAKAQFLNAYWGLHHQIMAADRAEKEEADAQPS